MRRVILFFLIVVLSPFLLACSEDPDSEYVDVSDARNIIRAYANEHSLEIEILSSYDIASFNEQLDDAGYDTNV